MDITNGVQLITYPDSLGGSLRALGDVLDEEFPGLFPGGVHVLPPFPSSGDRGFAPLTYDEIDPAFGTWADLRRIGDQAPVMLDVMVNHLSARSPQFQDYLARGDASPWADLFIPLDKVWPGGEPDATDLVRIFLRRARPWSTYPVGEPPVPTRVWTTFGREDRSEQVDVDVHSPRFRELVESWFARFAANGVQMVRLDAIGYLAKRAGTSCFMVQPDTEGILAWLDGVAARHGIKLLPEVHARPEVAGSLSVRGSWAYDFQLPFRVLEALLIGDARRLVDHLASRPARLVNTLDCHDGIPVKPDLDGRYEPGDVRRVVETCLARGGNLSRVVAREHQDADGFDVHQIRGTLFSLLGSDDDALVAARAIQLFVPGVPQVYYTGLLAGENDHAAAGRTGDGRAINRHDFTRAEIRAARSRSVVQRTERLIRLRNTHPAFDGAFEIRLAANGRIRLTWRADVAAISLDVDIGAPRVLVELTGAHGRRERFAL